MRRVILISALAAATEILALAHSARSYATESIASPPHQITVREAIGLAIALRQLDGRPTGKLDKDGAPVIEPYKFDGATLMAIAFDLNHIDQVVVIYQQQKNALIKKMSGGGVSVPVDNQADFLEQNDKMLDTPIIAQVRRLKLKDLCLDGKSPCPGTNAISPTTLGALMPLVDE
jgi:hypothetical protein